MRLQKDLVFGINLECSKIIFNNLKPNLYILKLDIESCFDRINNDKLISIVKLPQKFKNLVLSALKAGVLKQTIEMTKGDPQGTVILSLLCNVALDEIENIWNEQHNRKEMSQRALRYADYMILFIKPRQNANA